jgi:hypothetical protein
MFRHPAHEPVDTGYYLKLAALVLERAKRRADRIDCHVLVEVDDADGSCWGFVAPFAQILFLGPLLPGI